MRSDNAMAFHKLKKSIYHREHRVITKKVRQKISVNSVVKLPFLG